MPKEYSASLAATKPKSRWLKINCDCCGWSARASAKQIRAAEALMCPVQSCGGTLEQAA